MSADGRREFRALVRALGVDNPMLRDLVTIRALPVTNGDELRTLRTPLAERAKRAQRAMANPATFDVASCSYEQANADLRALTQEFTPTRKWKEPSEW